MPPVSGLDRRLPAAPETPAAVPEKDAGHGLAGSGAAEAALRLARRNPLYLLPLFGGLLTGKWASAAVGEGGSLTNLALEVGRSRATSAGASKSFAGRVAAAMRIHQWSKNLLLFVPLLAGHAWGDWRRLGATLTGVAAFNLLASATYVWNDLMDLDADRGHPVKCARPFAAGLLSVRCGLAMVMLLGICGGGAAMAVSGRFAALAAMYFLATVGYSLWLKRLMMIDVLVLAGLYTWRVMAGAASARVVVSHWLLGFSIFFFLSLALVKRCTELRRAASGGRGYRKEDYAQLARLGTASAYVAVLIMALYIQQPETAHMYRKPEYLWAVCPVLIYWLSRLWLLADRGELNEDPVLFAIGDRTSYWSGAVAAAALIAALGVI